ncbi:MAG: amidohydrolase family protein [bacterium]|nr:amidohydrolase [Deltaproteobacteria bacterium]MCP4907373.1 amidohydrolase family protein [bacterium]
MSIAARDLRSQLGHPVIDSDGHTVEYLPALLPYFQKAGVADQAEDFYARVLASGAGLWSALSQDERAARRAVRPSWWAVPTRNTRDFATATMPSLMYERMDEFGIDFSVIYPSLGLPLIDIADTKLRRACCRALNQFHADAFEGFEDRLTPVAIIPMMTPDEAIEELDYAVEELGFKAALIASFVRRPVDAVAEHGPAVQYHASWADSFGVDSPYDYDPFWARCVDLGISPAAHSGAVGWDGRRSTSNYMYNHIGFFAAPSETLCRSLFLGGVTRRFPTFRLALLEGGVSWACRLFNDLLSHWQKRNPEAIQTYNPAHFDRDLFAELLESHGGHLKKTGTGPDIQELAFGAPAGQAEPDDEFSACQIERPEDIADLFVPNFFFGCEADDPLVHHGFDRKGLPFGRRLNPIFGSDIGHWDVPEMRVVLNEAFELVEKKRIDRDEFRAFTFENIARFYTDANPNFFKGTAVEQDVDALLARDATAD